MQTQNCAPLQLTAYTSKSVHDWTGPTAIREEMDSVFVLDSFENKAERNAHLDTVESFE